MQPKEIAEMLSCECPSLRCFITRRWREKQHFLVVFYTWRAEVGRIFLLMNIAPYPFVRIIGNRYEFTSTGKRHVRKVVIFDVVSDPDLYNLAFGDLLPGLPEGEIDDFSNTDNGDMVRVLATVIRILIDFLHRNPQATVFFTGSTEARTNLYRRIISRYSIAYQRRYEIMASIWVKGKFKKVEFDPCFKGEYFDFFIKRKF
jgi:hypothetical protein